MGRTKYIDFFSQFIIKRELVDEEPSVDFNLVLTNQKKKLISTVSVDTISDQY